VDLHARFSTNTYGWQRWLFDHFSLPAGSQVLELGCGPDLLWSENRKMQHPDVLPFRGRSVTIYVSELTAEPQGGYAAMSLELNPEIERLLVERAHAAGTSASDYVARLLQVAAPTALPGPAARVRALLNE
jgi:hypothetical protein